MLSIIVNGCGLSDTYQIQTIVSMHVHSVSRC